jgi:RNA polymerase sigma factor (sigma-70 family)
MAIPIDKSNPPDPSSQPVAPDAGTVESWFLKYSHTVYLVCRKYLKDEEECRDAVMDIFHKILADGDRYRVSNAPAWLHAVTKNHCLMKIRKSRRLRVIFRPPAELDSIFVENADSATPIEKDPPDWEAWLACLQGDQKACIELFYMKNKSYREIADLRGIPVGQVKSHIQNGRRNLRIAASRTSGG